VFLGVVVVLVEVYDGGVVVEFVVCCFENGLNEMLDCFVWMYCGFYCY